MDKNTDKRFDVVTGKQDGSPMVSMIDKGYKHLPEIHSLPWFLWINIPLEDKRQDGLSTKEEDLMLEKLEQNIEDKMMSETKLVFVGRLTWNGSRELFYYVGDGATANSVLDGLVKNPPFGRGFQYEISKDMEHRKVAEMFGW